MLNILFFERAELPPTTATELEDLLGALPDIVWEAPAGAAYRPGRWRDPATGATALWDLGQPPLEDDDEPARTYSGWRSLPLTLSIPLAGPHWQAVTALAQVDRLLRAAPHLMPLDAEDTVADESAEPGPYPWDRPRVIASWERLRSGQVDGRSLPRLDRSASVALWRYRVDRAAARSAHRGYHWPDALVLLDRVDAVARTACLWTDAEEPFALPPVDLVVVRPATGAGAVPADELRLLAPQALPGGTRLVEPTPAVQGFFHGARPLPVERFTALGDEDWID